MSMYHTYKVTCPRGHTFPERLARGVNAERSPAIVQLILDGRFNLLRCPKCNADFRVEKPFSYTDLKRKLLIQVKPAKHYFKWMESSDKLAQKVARIPEKILKTGTGKVRVVYGLDELREKILCEHHRIDDRLLELVKVILIHEHPFLLHRPRLNFFLTSVNKKELVFSILFEHDKKYYAIRLTKTAFARFCRGEATIKAWLAQSTQEHNLLDPGKGNYINIRRLMPHTAALSLLSTFAAAVRKKVAIEWEAKDFRFMLSHLPRGSHLPTESKKQLKVLRNYAKARGLQELDGRLWEVYFGKELENEFWENRDKKDIDTLWRLFEDLPDKHIEGNHFIREVTYSEAQEDAGGGAYYSTGEIELGKDADLEDFEDTIRHEVGHAVYAKNTVAVNDWLQKRFGWYSYKLNEAGINEWVKHLGGWGTLTPQDRRKIISCLKKAYTKGGSWKRCSIKYIEKGHPWHKKNLAIRQIYEKSKSDWYESYPSWYRKNGKAFFLNYFYNTVCVVNESTLKLVAKMPSSYAAMSNEEFFAELYALYYDSDDRLRKNIDPRDMRWMKQNLK